MYLLFGVGNEHLQCVDAKWSTPLWCRSNAQQVLVGQSTDAGQKVTDQVISFTLLRKVPYLGLPISLMSMYALL